MGTYHSNSSAMQKVIKARAGLILDKPFFGSLALRLKAVEDKSCNTAWTDGRTLGYNPVFIDALSLEETKGMVAHEVMHIAFQHATRMKKRNRKQWNKAGDYAINGILLEEKFVLPGDALFNDTYKGMSADHIYSLLEAMPKSNNPDKPCNGGNGGNQSPDKQNDQQDDPQDDQQGSQDNQNNQEEPKPQDKYEDEDPGGCGAVREAQFDSPAQQAAFEQEWKVAVAQAAITAKSAGNMPGGMERVIGDILTPLANWKEVLRRFVDQAMKGDYSWMRPNRRYMQSGFYLPSLYSEEIGHIVVAVATSGSVDQDMLTQFASELTSIMEDYKTSCDILYCDTHIHKHQFVTSDDLPIKFTPCGFGGTNFRAPFEWVKENNVAPVCLIYLTDMCCNSFPDEEPSYPVLWAQYEECCFASEAPFGETVMLREEK